MLRSNAVAQAKPSSFCSVVLILGIGKGLLTIRLSSSLKSVIVRTVMSFFGIMNAGEAHSDNDCLFITPIPTNLFITFIRVALCICGMGYGLP